jgi:hypothetical protein
VPAKFCARDGCYEPAIGAARSRDYCRTDYLELVLKPAEAELVRCQVTGTTRGLRDEVCRVTDCLTGQSVAAPGEVTLDPAETKIAALVAAGAVKVIPSPAADKAKKA